MPLLTNPTSMTQQTIDGTGYGFSAKGVDEIGASEVTLVGIAIDRSGSTSGFQDRIEAAMGEIVRACLKSPRAGNLMLRLLVFDSHLDEIHGFKMLGECNPDDYLGVAKPRGATALYDASLNITESVTRYGKSLYQNGQDVNGIVFVITDGEENVSKMTVGEVKKAFEHAVRSESIESLRTVLIGLNVNASLNSYLQGFKDDAGFDQYVGIATATAKELAKLADFVSKSISSQSTALGSGGPSQSLTF